jgi:hypothetical protein
MAGVAGRSRACNEWAMNAVSIQNSSYATLIPKMEFTKSQHDESISISISATGYSHFTVVDFDQIFDFQKP